MFLFDPASTPDWEACRAELDRLMGRIGAKVIVANKWDERRLAYEIRGRKRGIYGLTYFEADPGKLSELERDTNLSEAVLRFLILQAEHLTEEEMKEVASRPASESGPEGEEAPRSATRSPQPAASASAVATAVDEDKPSEEPDDDADDVENDDSAEPSDMEE
jgi:small subunit ribosomal protein S6